MVAVFGIEGTIHLAHEAQRRLADRAFEHRLIVTLLFSLTQLLRLCLCLRMCRCL